MSSVQYANFSVDQWNQLLADNASTFVRLDLSNKNMTDESVSRLCQASAKTSAYIKDLVLAHNPQITEKSFASLLQAAKENPHFLNPRRIPKGESDLRLEFTGVQEGENSEKFKREMESLNRNIGVVFKTRGNSEALWDQAAWDGDYQYV